MKRIATMNITQPDKQWGVELVRVQPSYFNAWRFRYVLKALRKVTGKVLEVGGGAGAFAAAIHRERPDLKIMGTDLSPELVQLAQRQEQANTYTVADVMALPFGKREFQAVVGFDVFEHVEEPQRAFAEVYRVLKQGGRLHMAVPLEGSLATIHGWMMKVGVVPKRVYAGHIQQLTSGQVVGLLEAVGFKKVEVRYSGHLLFQLLDFGYFLVLSLLHKQVGYTVEGYEASLPVGWRRRMLGLGRALLATMCYVESRWLWWLPASVGHFTATK